MTKAKPLVLRHACSDRGAEMGRRSDYPEDRKAPIKLRLTRLRWVDGAYDQGGAYWGMGYPHHDYIYCAWTDEVTSMVYGNGYRADEPLPIRIYVRARDRREAKVKVLDELPEARFYV